MTTLLKTDTVQVVQDGDTDIVVRRTFAHPPARVWRALTDATLIPKWLSPVNPMVRCEMDARPGGHFHYEWKNEAGQSYYFSGPILAADAPRHMTHVEYFNGDTDAGVTVTTDLAAAGSGTRMTLVHRHADKAARAAAIASGMTDNYDIVYDALETVLDAL